MKRSELEVGTEYRILIGESNAYNLKTGHAVAAEVLDLDATYTQSVLKGYRNVTSTRKGVLVRFTRCGENVRTSWLRSVAFSAQTPPFIAAGIELVLPARLFVETWSDYRAATQATEAAATAALSSREASEQRAAELKQRAEALGISVKVTPAEHRPNFKNGQTFSRDAYCQLDMPVADLLDLFEQLLEKS